MAACAFLNYYVILSELCAKVDRFNWGYLLIVMSGRLTYKTSY